MYPWLMCTEYSTQCIQAGGLVERMLEHVCHVKDANVEFECEHQEKKPGYIAR